MDTFDDPGDDLDPVEGYRRRRAQLLAVAVAVLTEAARQPRPVVTGAVTPDGAQWLATGEEEPGDWAEFVTHALAGAAANLGGIPTILTGGHPGSPAAEDLRRLLLRAAGDDGPRLPAHRTEPLTVRIHLDELMTNLKVCKAYDDAHDELDRRYTAAGPDPSAARPTEDPSTALATVREELAELSDLLARQREHDWADYGQALQAHIELTARSIPDLPAVVVTLCTRDVPRRHYPARVDDPYASENLAEWLLNTAIADTALPGRGRAPLDRLGTSRAPGAGAPCEPDQPATVTEVPGRHLLTVLPSPDPLQEGRGRARAGHLTARADPAAG